MAHELKNGEFLNLKIGGYRFGEHLGSGGLSRVFMAHRHEKKFAAKVLNANFVGNKPIVKAFEREFEILSQIQVPGVPRGRDLIDVQGCPCLIMDYVPGIPLHRAVSQSNDFNRIELIKGMFEIVSRLHDKNVVHGDVKPENFLVLDCGHIYLVDFGNARWAQEKSGFFKRLLHGKRGAIHGTPAYLPPEIIKGADPNFASDCYSAGGAAYFVLTGKAPIVGDNAEEKIKRAVHQGAASLTERIARIPRELTLIIDRALQREPGVRPQHGREMLHALDVQIRTGRIQRKHGTGAVVRVSS